MAVSSPAIPTSGAVNAPRINGKRPSKAEALPAAWPCVSMANAKEEVPTTPIVVTKKKIGITMAQSGPSASMTANKMAPESVAAYNAVSKSAFPK